MDSMIHLLCYVLSLLKYRLYIVQYVYVSYSAVFKNWDWRYYRLSYYMILVSFFVFK